jgi:NADPH:quinone reductase-like Zn-dependent oxidoreductase
MPLEPAATHTAIFITAPGGPDVLIPRDVGLPAPADDQLLIEVHAAGLNRHDVNQRKRGPSAAHSDVPGLEVAGIVRGVGGRVTGWQPGERVCALTDGGGYAQYAVANAGHAFKTPPEMDDFQAAALPEALFTIWHNIFNLAALAPGESVLLHGGTSGVGTIAIQLLTRLGHPVFATCGSPEKIALAKLLGANAVFDYREEDFVFFRCARPPRRIWRWSAPITTASCFWTAGRCRMPLVLDRAAAALLVIMKPVLDSKNNARRGAVEPGEISAWNCYPSAISA